MVWSTDGKLATVIGSKGLRVCDAEGAISPVLIDRAGMFRWIPHEHQGVVVGFDYANSWNDLKTVLTDEQQKLVIKDAALLRKKVFTYHGDRRKFEDSALRSLGYPLQAALYLRATSSVDFEKLAVRKWPAYKVVRVPVFNIKSFHIDHQTVKEGPVIDRSIDEIVELRVSPNGKNLACVKHRRPQETNYISVFSIAGGEKLPMVAKDTGVYPDWSADSRYLYYSRINAPGEMNALRIPDLHEGGLFKTEIVDGAGKLIQKNTSQRLANVIFDLKGPVRALRDGRVLFLSRQIRFPDALHPEVPSELFSYSPHNGGRVDNLIHKEKDILYFEPSPDQEQLAVLSGGIITVSKINGSDPVEVNNKEQEASGILPQWRTNTELTYDVKTKPTGNPNKPSYIVMLWSRNGGNKDLSKNWSKEALSEVSVHRDLFQDAIGKIIEDMDRSAKTKK
ncbi:MAG: hypothetical protein K2X77_03350 [Candidatus Obscuribacterales bacterium]|jgi:hypothetical protein|nr:hypothetical protein [Candidatus Obscuribacterales bacterium]